MSAAAKPIPVRKDSLLPFEPRALIPMASAVVEEAGGDGANGDGANGDGAVWTARIETPPPLTAA